MAEIYPAPTPPAPAPKKKRRWLLTGCLSIVGLLVVCGVVSALMNMGGGTATTTVPVAVTEPTEVEPSDAAVAPAAPTEASAESAVPEESTSVPEPTATLEPTAMPEPTVAPVGKTRDSAAPVGEMVTTDSGWEIKVTGLERNAGPTLKATNQFNEDALPGYEWVLVSLAATYRGGETGTQRLTGSEVRLTGSKGVIYDIGSVVVDKPFEGEVFKDGTLEGARPFQVAEGESNLIVIFDPGFGNDAVFLAATEIVPPIVPPVEPEGTMDVGLSKDAPATGAVLADNGVQIKVLDVVRNATSRIKEENQFNEDPMPGNEYVMVHIQTQYFGGDMTNRDPENMYRIVGDKNVIYETGFTALKNGYGGEVYK